MNEPLVDLGLQRAEIADEVAEGWARVIAPSNFILGEGNLHVTIVCGVTIGETPSSARVRPYTVMSRSRVFGGVRRPASRPDAGSRRKSTRSAGRD